MSESDGETTCLACGMCCDGTLLNHASLESWRSRELSKEGFRVFWRNERQEWAFLLPCSHHVDRRCARFEDRPPICGVYRCKLLKRVESGETTATDALTIVESAQAMVAAIAADLRGNPEYDAIDGFRARVEHYARRADEGLEPNTGPVIERYYELIGHLLENFLTPTELTPGGPRDRLRVLE